MVVSRESITRLDRGILRWSKSPGRKLRILKSWVELFRSLRLGDFWGCSAANYSLRNNQVNDCRFWTQIQSPIRCGPSAERNALSKISISGHLYASSVEHSGIFESAIIQPRSNDLMTDDSCRRQRQGLELARTLRLACIGAFDWSDGSASEPSTARMASASEPSIGRMAVHRSLRLVGWQCIGAFDSPDGLRSASEALCGWAASQPIGSLHDQSPPTQLRCIKLNQMPTALGALSVTFLIIKGIKSIGSAPFSGLPTIRTFAFMSDFIDGITHDCF